MKKLFTLLVAIIPFAHSSAQDSFASYSLRQVTVAPAPTPAQTALAISKSFQGRPYAGNTLDESKNEALVVDFRAFDCTTFLETTLALSLSRHQLANVRDSAQFDRLFRENLTRIRYRNGQIDGFASRLHYFSEWLMDNEQKGIVQDVTGQIGGIRVKKPISYMTQYNHKYPQLSNPAIRKQIAKAELALSQQRYWFIPKQQIRDIEKCLQDGDIIMMMAVRPGLDVKHVGMVVWQTDEDGVRRVHLLHASSQYGEVAITEVPLAEYVKENRQFSGIRVARLKETVPPTMAYSDARRIN